MKIRKQIETLTLGDLDQYPIWEFALDEKDVEGQDETTVRPVEKPGFALGKVLIKAKFIFVDGTEHVGFLTPTEDHPGLPLGLAYVHPVIVKELGHVGFWNGVLNWKPREIERYYQILGKKAKQVFPITYSSTVSESKASGEIPGFLQLVHKKCGLFSKRTDEIKVLT